MMRSSKWDTLNRVRNYVFNLEEITMDKVQMIKEEIRRMMNEAELYNEKWLTAFEEAEGGDAHCLMIAVQYKAEYSAFKRLLQYIEREVE